MQEWLIAVYAAAVGGAVGAVGGFAGMYAHSWLHSLRVTYKKVWAQYDKLRVIDSIFMDFELSARPLAGRSVLDCAYALVEVEDEGGHQTHRAVTHWSVSPKAQFVTFTGAESVLVLYCFRKPRLVFFVSPPRLPGEPLTEAKFDIEKCENWQVSVTLVSPNTRLYTVKKRIADMLDVVWPGWNDQDVREGRNDWPSEGMLLRRSGDQIYVVHDNKKRLIPKLSIFQEAGCDIADVWKVTDRVFRELRDGTDISTGEELKQIARKG